MSFPFKELIDASDRLRGRCALAACGPEHPDSGRIDAIDEGVEGVDEGVDNVDRGLDNFDEGIDNFDEGIDNFDEGVDNVNRGVDNVDRGVDNFDEGVDNFDRGIDNFDRGIDERIDATETPAADVLNWFMTRGRYRVPLLQGDRDFEKFADKAPLIEARLRTLREKKEVTEAESAERTSLRQSHISDVERGVIRYFASARAPALYFSRFT